MLNLKLFPYSLRTLSNKNILKSNCNSTRLFLSLNRKMSEAAKNEDKVKNLPNEESDDEDDNGDEKGKDNKHGSESAKSKRMKKALESIGNLTGSTHSNSDVISTIMSAQHKVFGPLKLEDLGPEEKSRSRTHVNPLSIQFLEVS